MKKILFYLFIFLASCGKETIQTPNNTEMGEITDTTTVEMIDTTCVPLVDIPLGDSLYYLDYWKGEQEFGFATAIKDSLDWEADARAVIIKDSMILLFVKTLYSQEQSHRTREIFSMELPIEMGCFSVNPDLSGSNNNEDEKIPDANYDIVDLDVFVNQYTLSEDNIINKVELINVDTTTKAIEGKFMLTFLRNETDAPQCGPDTLRFYNGYFKCQIVD